MFKKIPIIEMKDEEIKTTQVNPRKNTTPIESDLQQIEKRSSLDKSFEQLFSEKDFEQKTQLSNREVRKLAILKSYAEKYQFTELISVIREFMHNRVSLKRMGRKELVEVAKAERLNEQLQNMNQNLRGSIKDR